MPRYGGKWVFGQKYYRNEFLQKGCLNRLCDSRNFERAVCRSLFYLGAYQHVLLRFMGQTGSSPTHTTIRAGTTQPSPRVYRGRNSHTFQGVLHFRLPSAPQRYNTLDFPGKVVCHETAGFFGFFRSKGNSIPSEHPRQRRTLFPFEISLPIGMLLASIGCPGTRGDILAYITGNAGVNS